MKTVLENIELIWWNFHIRMMDESDFVRELVPQLREVWDLREEAAPYLVWSVLGFPLGIVLGLLTTVVN